MSFLEEAINKMNLPETDEEETIVVPQEQEGKNNPPKKKDKEDESFLQSAIDKQFDQEDENNTEAEPPASEEGDDDIDDFDSPFNKQKGDDDNEEEEDDTEEVIKNTGMDQKAGDKFRELKAANKALKEQLASIGDAAEIEQLKEKASALEKIIQERDELQNKISLLDYKESSEWKKNITEPMSKIASLADMLETQNGLEKGSVMKAINTRDYRQQSANIEAIKRSLDSRSLTTLTQMANDVFTIFGREEEIKKSAIEKNEEYRERERLKLIEDSEREQIEFKKNVGDVFKNLGSKIPLFLKEGNVDEKVLNQYQKQAESIDFLDLPNEDLAYAALASVAFKDLVKKTHQYEKEINSLKKRLGANAIVDPNGNSDSPTQQRPSDKKKDITDLNSAIEAMFD